MDALEIIRTRHSIAKVKPDPLPRPLVEKLLDAAVQAPNHHHTQPWRFVVLTGQGRERLGEVMAQSLRQQKTGLPDSALDIERAKPLRAPLLIAVGVEKSSDPRVFEIEELCATAAAVENLLLAAHALGLGAMWRTGPAVRDPPVKQFLGFASDQPLVGFIYVGYPDVQPDFAERPSFKDRTVWMD
jgi:nitroreductase